MDLSARNVLVTTELRCKVSDFGLASKELYYAASATRPMAVRWMAPEVLRGGRCTRASDVWSFGIMVYELATNCSAVPFAGLSAAAVVAAVSEGRRPDSVSNMPPQMVRVMDNCTRAVREERPTFASLCRALKKVTPASGCFENVPEHCGEMAVGVPGMWRRKGDPIDEGVNAEGDSSLGLSLSSPHPNRAPPDDVALSFDLADGGYLLQSSAV